MSRFDYVKYDPTSQNEQASFKAQCEKLETMIETMPTGRPKALALTSLEECYMWIGKGIRDAQIARQAAAGETTEQQEERTDG